jgi:hypothetical protein
MKKTTFSFLILIILFQITFSNRETVTLIQNELQHHSVAKPEIDESNIKGKIFKGDMILDKINLTTEDLDLEKYLREKYEVTLDKYKFLEAARFSDSITIHNYFYNSYFSNMVLKEYIAIAKTDKFMNFVDLFVLYTEITFQIPSKIKKEQSGSTCLNLFGYEFCKYLIHEDIVTPYDFKDILQYEKLAKFYSFEKFKQILDNYILQIYIHTGTDFDIVELTKENRDFYRDITRDWKSNLRMLPGALTNYEALKRKFVDFHNIHYPNIKIKFMETLRVYSSTILGGDQFKNLERSSKLQMIKGIDEIDLNTYFDSLKKRISLPSSKYQDLDYAIKSIIWSDSLQWYCVDMLYSVEELGKVKYAAILGNRDENGKYSFLVSEVQATFDFYDKLIIIQKSSLENHLIFDYGIEVKDVPKSYELDADNMIFLMKNLAFKTYAKYFGINVDLS